RPLIADVLVAFERAGLELTRLSVSALALAENIADAIEPTALIDLEPGEMDVVVAANSQLLFTRSTAFSALNAAPDVLTTRLVEEVARSFTAYQNEFRNRPLEKVYLSVAGVDSAGLENAVSQLLEMPVERLQSRYLPAGDPDAQPFATAIGMAVQGM